MKQNNYCYWITGLSGSGKSTISQLLKARLEEKGQQTILLDGDILRKVFDSKAFSFEDRKALGYKYSKLCKLLVDQGFNVIIAAISLFHDIHKWNKENITNYVEIFLDTPLEECVRRDVKGIYEKSKRGKINSVAGVDIKVEYPRTPDIKVAWSKKKGIAETFNEIEEKLMLNYPININKS